MTLAPERLLHTSHGPAEPEPRLVELLADLGQLGVHGRVLNERLGGEWDVRLQAWRDTGDVTVELLWCCPGAPLPRRPESVRIAGGERAVWRSVHGRCAPAEIVRFLSDLLLLDDGALACRYRRLG